ncbi:hypothetical protein ACFX2J_026215 [Malus domestica]
MYGIKVSRHRQRTPGSNEETCVTISPCQSSPRVISIGSDSTNAGCSETKREEDLNWFPRPTALCKFRSWRAPNRFNQVQGEYGCSNTWIITVSSGPPPSYSAHTVEIRHSNGGSTSSSQGASSAREFQTEVELLMRIHHRNLASFIGYCDDIDKLALMYKYMPNENLKEYL